MMRQQPRWSPNGRYLAFVAILDAASSDLFVYDVQEGNLRRLTNGPDWVGAINWSPDGTQIIMRELLNDSEFFFDPHAKPPSSVWSVSVSNNEIQFLYATSETTTEENILFWLDDKRFFAYEGRLVDADQAHNLRLVDMETGTNRILFDGQFVMESFDPIHEVFALYELQTEKYPQGIYLVSVKNGTIRYLEGPPYNAFADWDETIGLFVSEDPCENDPNSLQAFDHLGNFKCVPELSSTPEPDEIISYPAPNGTSNLSVKDGLWLETQGKAPVPVSRETASDIIWCPDSSCFFFSVPQPNYRWTLYRVSLPDLSIKMVDEGIESRGTYQWLEVEK
jgi:WD40 repeat protein